MVCFAVKACSNLAVLRLFHNLGSGFDIVSGGELFRVLSAGADAGKVVYSGVGKTRDEIRAALQAGIMMFNVESEQELAAIADEAKTMGRIAPVTIRVNPDVDPQTHPKISTGMREHKFGIDTDWTLDLYQTIRKNPNLEAVGAACHIGSQLTSTAPFVEAITKLLELLDKLTEQGLKLRYLDLGGGLGITYNDEKPPLPKEYAQQMLKAAQGLSATLILEPGRVVVGNAAVLLTKVLYTKQTDLKRFIIVDAGMNDCLRPAMYDAHHDIQTVRDLSKETCEPADVVGPICESSDYLARNRPLPQLENGDLMALMSAGAYCFTMASNYNARPRGAEVLVDGSRYQVIRKAENYEDLIQGETVPASLT